MAHVSHKLSGPVEGALAGGGDPATSPLYVFGPFLRLLLASGVASIVFGAAIWLAVLTVITVSAMYRLVMIWVTDGSGGSGLNEEEFGGWAVQVNAGITVVEYTLTFLVSIAALVTFVADRFASLNATFLGVPGRVYVAVLVTIGIGFAVNLGPRIAARTFGPATAAVLVLLWGMIGATIWQFGVRLPDFQWQAFAIENLHVTLGGYARILALMTGIEIFANLVAAYEGPARLRSRKAFGSLLIIMGTTSLTMIIVGPAIMQLADPMDTHVSVFTQTMDKLLPGQLPYVGTLIGIAVLLSAAAASAQGIQNLALGLRYRHYIPAWFGQRNRFEVASKPVWAQAGVCILCFLVFGTREDTYLALYAAGVFILLSLTGWAAVKRLLRTCRGTVSLPICAALGGTAVAAVLTTGATLIIFEERFFEGAWSYLLFIPMFYIVFGYFRARLGEPDTVEDRLGLLIASSNLSPPRSDALYAGVNYKHILVPLDQSPTAELALATAQTLARNYASTIHVLTVLENHNAIDEQPGPPLPVAQKAAAQDYLADVVADLSIGGYQAESLLEIGQPAQEIGRVAMSQPVDLLIMSTHGRSRIRRWIVSSVTTEVIFQTTPPILVLRPTEDWRSTRTRFARLLVTLDGSATAEQVLPHVHALATKFGSEVTLLSVPEGSESDDYAEKLRDYLKRIADSLARKEVQVDIAVTGSVPTQTILRVSQEKRSDLIMMVSHGRGGVRRQPHVKLGSVVETVLQETPCPLFLVSAR